MFIVGEHPPPGFFFAVFAQFPRKFFCLRAIAARILVDDRLLLEQVAVEMQALLDVSRGCFMGSGMQDQKGLVPALARTVWKSCV